MPRKKWIDRNDSSTQTYQLLYRSQNDPLLHDESAGERALFAVSGKSLSVNSAQTLKDNGLHLVDLEAGNDIDLQSMRENEGEAAEHGVYFDDTEYDYMQHLRDIGQGGGESHFVEAASTMIKGKGKAKTKSIPLEDALRQVSLEDESQSHSQQTPDEDYARMKALLADTGSTMSKTDKQRKLESQQDIPDEIAGFQPNMDYRLREVLEALDDDAYVDGEDEEDIFGELTKHGKNDGEIDLAEFELNALDEDDGWESDVTEKATGQLDIMRPTKMPVGDWLQHQSEERESTEQTTDQPSAAVLQAAVAEDGQWLEDFAKFKRDQISSRKDAVQTAEGSVITTSAVQDRAPTLYTLNGTPLRQKKRKGAMTNPSAYSMTSSSLARTEGQQLLDARFDQVEKMYALDEMDELEDMDAGMSQMSGLTGQSRASMLSTTSFADKSAVRSDFDGMMDNFLGDWNRANPGGKRNGVKGKRGKNGNEKHGLAQLEEVRTELGRGRLMQKVQKV